MTVAYVEKDTVNRHVNENLTQLLFRMGWKQNDLARAIGMTPQTVNRKMHGVSAWTLPEADALCKALNVEVGQLLGELPDYDTWRSKLPHLDSNQKPADLQSTEVSIIRLDDYRARRVS